MVGTGNKVVVGTGTCNNAGKSCMVGTGNKVVVGTGTCNGHRNATT